MAIEEAFMADQGFTEKLMADINIAAGNTDYDETVQKGIQDVIGTNQFAGSRFLNQVISLRVCVFI